MVIIERVAAVATRLAIRASLGTSATRRALTYVRYSNGFSYHFARSTLSLTEGSNLGKIITTEVVRSIRRHLNDNPSIRRQFVIVNGRRVLPIGRVALGKYLLQASVSSYVHTIILYEAGRIGLDLVIASFNNLKKIVYKHAGLVDLSFTEIK